MKLAYLILAAGVLIVSRAVPSGGAVNCSAICIFFGLVCIWCAEYLGAFTGPVGRGGMVDTPTPAPLFTFLGWLLLCVPLVVLAWS